MRLSRIVLVSFILNIKDESEMTNTSSITYILEIRIGSMKNDPVYQLESNQPFGAMSIGDKFYHEGLSHEAWHDLPKKGEVYFITDIAHIISEITSGKILHSILVCLNVCAY